MKLSQTMTLSLAVLSIGTLLVCNSIARAIPTSWGDSTSKAQFDSPHRTSAQLCLAEAKRNKIDRAVVGADDSTTRGIIEIDTASDTFICRIERGRVLQFSRSRQRVPLFGFPQ